MRYVKALDTVPHEICTPEAESASDSWRIDRRTRLNSSNGMPESSAGFSWTWAERFAPLPVTFESWMRTGPPIGV